MQASTSSMVLVLSGQMGSGKTTVARELVRKLNTNFASFGSFVRTIAISRGIGFDRVSLQNLGQALIGEFGPDEFVKEVLISGQSTGSTITVLDGVRSVEIWHSVQKLASRSVLVYLDIEEDERIRRLVKRDGLDTSSIQLAMQHSMERNIPELRIHADFVLHSNSIDKMVSEVMVLLMIPGFDNSKNEK